MSISMKEMARAIGFNTRNHAMDSRFVTSNRDGSVMERLENIIATMEQTVSKEITSIVTQDLFQVTGGPIKVVEVWGLVTTVIQTQNCSVKLLFDPTLPAGDIDLCAALEITTDAVGTLYSITGTEANAMVAETDNVADTIMAQPLVMGPGMIELHSTATNTGKILWGLRFQPMAEGVEVIAQ